MKIYMRLEYYSEKKLKKEILKIVRDNLGSQNYRVFFFGSRVRGDNFPRADVDIGIEGSVKLPIEVKFKLKEEIDKLPTLYKFDIIDFKNVSETFKKEALKHIEYVN